MSLSWSANGEYATGPYQISAMPYVTSSIISAGQVHRYDFGYVTKFICVVNKGSVITDSLAISFTENGLKPTSKNYFTLEKSETVREELRTTSLFVSCSSGTNVDYQLLCGLTNIPSKNFLTITGSNGHSGVG